MGVEEFVNVMSYFIIGLGALGVGVTIKIDRDLDKEPPLGKHYQQNYIVPSALEREIQPAHKGIDDILEYRPSYMP